MNHLNKLVLKNLCGIILCATQQSWADPIRLCVEHKTGAGAPPDTQTCNLFVQFETAYEVVLTAAFSHVTTNSPTGFFQELNFGGDLPPNNALCLVIPALCFDSYVTLGTKNSNPNLLVDPDFPADPDGAGPMLSLFNCNPSIAGQCPDGATMAGTGDGGWFAIPAMPPLGTPQPPHNTVILAQFTVPVGAQVSSPGLTVFMSMPGGLPPNFTFPFECFGPGAVICGSEPDCDVPNDCDDGNDCTDDTCFAGVCANSPSPAGTPCGWAGNSQCDHPDTCSGSGVCQPNYEPVGTTCGNGSDTDCYNPDTCNGNGACNPNNEPVGTPCGDPSDTECDNPDTCNGLGTCDNNVPDDGTQCNDGDQCTEDKNDHCQAGLCVGGPLVNCDDGDICSGTETCVTSTGCMPGTPLDCNDNDACTVDSCDASGCTHIVIICDDGDPCTTDTCDPASGCAITPECTGDDGCAAGEVCSAGCCVPSGAVDYALDIRHNKCPNKLKVHSNGEVKVYIAGAVGSDVHLIDLDSLAIRLCGGSESILPRKPPRIKDKVGPHLTDCGDCSCAKLKKDYIDDIEIKFKGLADLIDDSVLEGTLIDMEVYGTLLDGTPFTAHDCVLVDRPGSGTP